MSMIRLLALLALSVSPVPAVRADCTDLALVLAIDGSGSVSAGDFALQKAGYAAAFTDARVLSALASAGRVEVAVVLWGDGEVAPQILHWQRIDGPRDAARLAGAIAAMPRRVTGDTGIGGGLWAALDLIEMRGCATRRIVNISGDGRESQSPRSRNHVPLAVARARAAAMGVTVNGLAITAAEAELPDWYATRVITGPDAFVMTASSMSAFGEAIIRKLEREIAVPVLALADPTG